MRTCKTKAERALLLFFEACAVDNGGAVDVSRMNDDDLVIAHEWNQVGFVEFGRIACRSLPGPKGAAHWCRLSMSAWNEVGLLRLERADRRWKAKKWEQSRV